MTDADLLERAGEALHGRNVWKGPLADDLGVSPRTLQRWATGQAFIPPGVWGEIAGLLREHSAEAAQLAEQLPAPPRS